MNKNYFSFLYQLRLIKFGLKQYGVSLFMKLFVSRKLNVEKRIAGIVFFYFLNPEHCFNLFVRIVISLNYCFY
jgi:hypothetical protein